MTDLDISAPEPRSLARVLHSHALQPHWALENDVLIARRRLDRLRAKRVDLEGQLADAGRQLARAQAALEKQGK